MRTHKNIIHAVLVKFWQAFLLLLYCSKVLSHENGDCKLHKLSDSGEKDMVTCSIKKLDENFQVQNYSIVEPHFIKKLAINCDELYYYQSILNPNAFLDLFQVTDFNLVHCKINEISDNVFVHLRNIRNLTFRTNNYEWPAMSLSVAPKVFRPLPLIETLDLSTNNIWELPTALFCSLSNLKYLNLSFNHLQDLTQVGFSAGAANAANSSQPCRSDVVHLDLSFNDADVVVAGAFRSLSRMEKLFLNHNSIGKVDDEAFKGLGSLTTLDLSDNRLVALPENAFMYTPDLMYFRVRNNSLTVLAPGLFRGLQHLVELDLSLNDIKSTWLKDTTFEGLIRLRFLNLSQNKISYVNPAVFRDMYSVQELRLSNNHLVTIPPSSFMHCVNLHTLDLSNNQIRTIPNKAFDGINVLSFLSIDNNIISQVDESAFSNLTSLKDLNINGNLLRSIPRAISHLRQLKTVDLGDNLISSLNNLPVKGLQFLYGLRLVNNRISGNLSKNTFTGIPSLKILNLAKNRIDYVESGAFQDNRNLQAIRLDANLLTSMNGLFSNLTNLQWLNVSDNHINYFDYTFLPSSLLWLDLHKNEIKQLSNYLERHDLQLQTLDASHNKISYISSLQIPNTVQLLFLNDNEISIIEPFTFVKKVNLTRVDLFGNQLTKMDFQALRLSSVASDKTLPQFYLGGNSFICDCKMEWLQRINTFDSRDYPTIMDAESIYCKMPYMHGGIFLPLEDVQPSEFICQFESHCFSVCHCCEFDACDCEMTCPSGCSCFHDHSWTSNIVNCSSNNFHYVPDRIPMDASEVYIDGNTFKNLSSHSFIGRKHLQVLWANASAIRIIDNGTFSGLTQLNVLHLEGNYLETLKGDEFIFLTLLRELFLHKNKLNYIGQHTFASMSDLEVLTLHDNCLANFPVWRLVDNPYLMKLSLRGNQWTCECQFAESFEIWLSDNLRKVVDSEEIECVSTYNSLQSAYILEYNATNCLNSSMTSTVIQPMVLLDNLLHPMIAIAVSFVIIVILLVCFLYRNSIRVWMYSKCGLKFCRSKGTPEDKDKLFDAFISYSSKDEAWVNQVLAGELERGDKPYRICLHYRDFPVTAYITDTIVEAVESSKRTIIVLSKNFIENEWCRFQFKSAHHEVLKKRRKRIVVVILGDIPSRDLDPDLRLYLKTSTCIHTNDKLFWEKLQFAMPENSNRVIHTYSTIPEGPNSNKYSVNAPVSLHHNNIQGSEAYWA